MNKFNSVVLNSKLPQQLKEYFTNNKKIKAVLEINLIRDIEELYIFYKNHYIFDTSEFSAYVITSLRNCSNKNNIYCCVKKTIGTHLEFESSDSDNFDTNHRFNLDSGKVEKAFAQVFNDFCGTVDQFYKQNLDTINLIQTYKNLGKMELITDLVNDKDYKDLLGMGKNMLGNYIKCDG